MLHYKRECHIVYTTEFPTASAFDDWWCVEEGEMEGQGSCRSIWRERECASLFECHCFLRSLSSVRGVSANMEVSREKREKGDEGERDVAPSYTL